MKVPIMKVPIMGDRGATEHGRDMTEVERLAGLILRRIESWSAGAWQLPAGTGTRADAVRAAVTGLADLAADAEERPRRPVPRLPDPAAIDQLAVMVYDLLGPARTDPELAGRAHRILLELAEQVRITG